METSRVLAAFVTRAAMMNKSMGSSKSVLQYVAALSDRIEGCCSTNEIAAVTNFLEHEDWTQSGQNDVKSSFEAQMQTFINEEPQMSRLDPQKLLKHSGPLEATIAVILHVDHYRPTDEENYIPGNFWNIQNQSIQQFIQKGFSDTFTLGFDWHWRAAPKANHCPMKNWGRIVRAYHDQFSVSTLDLLPCKVLVIGGACPWNSYKQSICTSSKCLSFAFESIRLEIVLEFEITKTKLRRIAMRIDHPAFGFWNPSIAPEAGFRFDAQCNFALWLTGNSFVEKSQQTAFQNQQRGRHGSAPLTTLWEYRAREDELGKTLGQEHMEPTFLGWAGRFLQRNPSQLGKSVSLIKLIEKELRQRLSAASRASQADKWMKNYKHGFNATLYRRTTSLRVGFEIGIRRIRFKVPYHPRDIDVLKKLESLDVQVKIDFGADRASTCVPNADPDEPAHGLRVQFTYEVKVGGEKRLRTLWITQSRATSTHAYLCKINSLADFVMGKEKEFTLSQTHRFISKNLYKRNRMIKGDCYTVCSDMNCVGCAMSKKSIALITPS